MPDFDLERLLVLRSKFIPHAIFHGAQSPLLKPFLQRRFVVGALQSFDRAFQCWVEQSAVQECCGGFQSAVEVDRADHSFVRVSEYSLLLASAGFFLAWTETQINTE